MRLVDVLISSSATPARSTRYRELSGRSPIPAPRSCSSDGERSWMLTSKPASASRSPAVSPPSDPPAMTTRPRFTTCSRLAERRHPVDGALEQDPPLVERRVADAVGRIVPGVLGPDPVELFSDPLALDRVVFEDLPLDRALDADPVVRVLRVDEQERQLLVLADPLDLLAMSRHVQQHVVAVVVEPHRRLVDPPVVADEPKDGHDRAVEELLVDRI